MKKIRLAILKNEMKQDHHLWQEACEGYPEQIEWEVIDLTRHNWLDQIRAGDFDGCLARPPAYSNTMKQLYDERVEILESQCQLPVYPSLRAIKIYENKKYLSYWLTANKIPPPENLGFL